MSSGRSFLRGVGFGKAGLLGVFVAAIVGVIMLSSCELPTPKLPTSRAPVVKPKTKVGLGKIAGEPFIRVRIGRSVDGIRFLGPSRIVVHPEGREDEKQMIATPAEFRVSTGQWLGDLRTAISGRDETLVVSALGPTDLKTDRGRYPGKMRLVPRAGKGGASGANQFDLVNFVRLERYLPGVLDRELYDHWTRATYTVQAIVARTYAIDRIHKQGPGRHFDVESTQASQAYVGATLNEKANNAVAESAGMVLTYGGRVFTAYYSSTCGGAGQSPREAFGISLNIEPLQAKKVRDWCRGSKHYAWGPFRRSRAMFSRRLRQWGRSRGLSIQHLGLIEKIEIQRNGVGRSVRFVMTDDKGKRYALLGDSFRVAANYSDRLSRLDPPSSGVRLKSGFVDAEVEGDYVVFRNGHGLGHGVGLCQYGAEGMARRGRPVLEILNEYYPGAKVERAY